MMVRRETIEQAGEMPELYFLYYEELDWSERITRSGWDIGYEPRCTVFHKESRTTGRESPLRTYYLTRNRLLFGWRNRRGAATPADGTLPMRRSGAEKCGDRPAPRSGRPRPRNGTGHRRFFYDEKQNGLDAALA